MNEPPQNNADSSALQRGHMNPMLQPSIPANEECSGDGSRRSQAGSQDLIDLLIAISVVARHLARKLEAQTQKEEKEHEQDERTGDDPG